MSYTEVTTIEILVCLVVVYMLSKTRSRRITSKAKPPKYISRRDNPFKENLRRFSKASTDRWCARARAQNMAFPSDARDALCSALRSLGMRPEIEVRITAYGRDYFLDVLIRDQRIWFECDGAGHREKRRKDLGRDEAIKAVTGYRVIRKWNSWYTKPGLRERILNKVGRKEKHAFS